MLRNAYFLAKICADTAENEQHFAEYLPKIGNGSHIAWEAASACARPRGAAVVGAERSCVR